MTETKFTKTHEWARLEDDGTITIGITDHAQHALGDMVFVEQPDQGEIITAGKECAVVESVKSASDVYSPLSGEVIATNDEVVNKPEIINKDPQNSGWLFKIRPSNIKELDTLMDGKAYEKYLAETAH
jgi:glycine cleavage system H protein